MRLCSSSYLATMWSIKYYSIILYARDFKRTHLLLHDLPFTFSSADILGTSVVPPLFTNIHQKYWWDPSNFYSYSNIEESWTAFKEVFERVCYQHAPLCKSRLRNWYYPWITSAIVKSMYERDFIHRRAVNLKSHVLMAGYRKLINMVCHDIDIGKGILWTSYIR